MGNKITIESANTSNEKGIPKIPAEWADLTLTGIKGDAHNGSWPLQVSMLSSERIEQFSKQKKRTIGFGEFAENLTVRGMDLSQVRVFDIFSNDTVVLEVTQAGRKSSPQSDEDECFMSEHGIFLKVVKGGRLMKGDRLTHVRKQFKVMIITVSDRASAGIYKDRSGPRVRQLCESFFTGLDRDFHLEGEIVPDDRLKIADAVNKAVSSKYDIIITTGGTGIGPRDNTPEAVRPILEKEIPGIMELVRVKYGMNKPNAALSRSIAGAVGKSLVYCLPGSEKAVVEYMEEIFKTLNHALIMLYGYGDH